MRSREAIAGRVLRLPPIVPAGPVHWHSSGDRQAEANSRSARAITKTPLTADTTDAFQRHTPRRRARRRQVRDWLGLWPTLPPGGARAWWPARTNRTPLSAVTSRWRPMAFLSRLSRGWWVSIPDAVQALSRRTGHARDESQRSGRVFPVQRSPQRQSYGSPPLVPATVSRLAFVRAAVASMRSTIRAVCSSSRA